MNGDPNKPPEPISLNYQSPIPRQHRRLFSWPFFLAFPFTWAYAIVVGIVVSNSNDGSVLAAVAFAILVGIAAWSIVKQSQPFGIGIIASIILTPVMIVLLVFGACYLGSGGRIV